MFQQRRITTTVSLLLFDFCLVTVAVKVSTAANESTIAHNLDRMLCKSAIKEVFWIFDSPLNIRMTTHFIRKLGTS